MKNYEARQRIMQALIEHDGVAMIEEDTKHVDVTFDDGERVRLTWDIRSLPKQQH